MFLASPPFKACAMRSPTSSEHACPTSGFLCGRLLVALVESVLRPGGWENMCRLMCHCVRHTSLDNKHGRSVKAIHSFLSHILPPAGTQNALDESQKKASTQQAARSITLLARCRRAHGARLGRWRSQKHRWWPSAGVSGGGRDLTLRADDPTSRGTTQPPTNPTQHQTTPLKARFSCWALGMRVRRKGPHPGCRARR